MKNPNWGFEMVSDPCIVEGIKGSTSQNNSA